MLVKRTIVNGKNINKASSQFMLPVLENMNLTKPEIESSYFSNHTINLLIGLHTAQKSPANGDTVIVKRLFVYSKNLQNSERSLVCIDSDGYSSTDSILNRKFLILNDAFIKTVDTLYLPIVAFDTIQKSLFVKQRIYKKKTQSVGVTKDLNDILPGVPEVQQW